MSALFIDTYDGLLPSNFSLIQSSPVLDIFFTQKSQKVRARFLDSTLSLYSIVSNNLNDFESIYSY